MSSIGSRLREERERLEYNQSELAEIGRTTRKSQFNYESDARRPDADYFAAIAAAGANVLYILTGSADPAPGPQLSGAERTLLAHFRDAPPSVRKAAIAVLLSAIPAASAESKAQIVPTKSIALPRKSRAEAQVKRAK